MRKFNLVLKRNLHDSKLPFIEIYEEFKINKEKIIGISSELKDDEIKIDYNFQTDEKNREKDN
jgi:hypothetical protein